jgi:SagB-type dehydrogenase family enzyme
MGSTITKYHERTKHHFRRYAKSAGRLDWATQPEPFRRFEGARLASLPIGVEREELPYDSLYSPVGRPAEALDVESISDFLYHSLAISAWKAMGDTKWELRVNPSSGNLHPTEGYLVLPPVEGISDAPGVYHYAPKEHGLEERCRLTPAVWKKLVKGLPEGSFFVGLSSVCWREAWKYGERAFRYCQHDTGHAIAALSLAAALSGWRIRALPGWSQDAVETLLGVDRNGDFPVPEEREEAEVLLLVSPGVTDVDPSPAAPKGEWTGTANRLSSDHHPWPIIEEAAAATRAPGGMASSCLTPAHHFEVSARRKEAREIIRQRRSGVAFDGESEIHVEGLVRILARTLPGPHPPFEAMPWRPNVHLALFVHRVDGLLPGLYLLVREPAALKRLSKAIRADAVWEKPRVVPEELPLYLLLRGECQEVAAELSCGQDIAGASYFSLGMIADFAGPIAKHGDWVWRLLRRPRPRDARARGRRVPEPLPLHDRHPRGGHEADDASGVRVGARLPRSGKRESGTDLPVAYMPYFSMISFLPRPRMPYLSPTFLNASIALSRCSLSWAAESWVRIRACAFGTTGWKKPIT